MRHAVAVLVVLVFAPTGRAELIPVTQMTGVVEYRFLTIAPQTPGPIGKTVTFPFITGGVDSVNGRFGPPFFSFATPNPDRFTVVDVQAGIGQTVYTLEWGMVISHLELGTLNLGKVVATGIVRDNAPNRMELFAIAPSGVVTPGFAYDMSPFSQGALFSGDLEFTNRDSFGGGQFFPMDINSYFATGVVSHTPGAFLRPFRLRAIPEPTTLTLLAIAGVVCMAWLMARAAAHVVSRKI